MNSLVCLMAVIAMVTSLRPEFPVLETVEDIEKIYNGGNSSLSDCLRRVQPKACDTLSKFRRRLDGTCNNLNRPRFGAAFTELLQPAGFRYFDKNGLDVPPNHPALKEFSQFPSADATSRQLFESKGDDRDATVSLMFMVFGQFLDHDLSLTPYSEERIVTNCQSILDFSHPRYPIFDVASFGTACRSFFRAFAICQGSSTRTARRHPNVITSFVDASNVYGSSDEHLEELRDPKNRILLNVTRVVRSDPRADLLPIVEGGCVGGYCFEAGDERASEHVGLQTMHTIFVREHNRIARKLKEIRGNEWDDETIFFTAKRIVEMIMQRIVYKEFLPLLVTIDPYIKYDPRVNPGIIDGFSTAAYRFGHSLIRNNWPILNGDFRSIAGRRNLPLPRTFLNITELEEFGIEEIVFGYLRQEANSVDTNFAPGIFNRLFNNVEEENDSGLSNFRQSLISRNIHRGRDQGLEGYLQWRKTVGLSVPLDDTHVLDDIDPKDAKRLLRVFRDIRKNIDLFPGGFLERKVGPNKLVGPTFDRIITWQFENLRNGDRFYYENTDMFAKDEIAAIEKVSMSSILCENLIGIKTVPKNAFRANSASEFFPCSGFLNRLDVSVFTKFPKGKGFY